MPQKQKYGEPVLEKEQAPLRKEREGEKVDYVEATKMYSESLLRYHKYFGHTLTMGVGEGERSFARRCRDKDMALAAPYAVEQKVRAAGLDFRTVWETVHKCRVEDVPGLWFRNWKTGEDTACRWSPRGALGNWGAVIDRIALQAKGRFLTDEGAEMIPGGIHRPAESECPYYVAGWCGTDLCRHYEDYCGRGAQCAREFQKQREDKVPLCCYTEKLPKCPWDGLPMGPAILRPSN